MAPLVASDLYPAVRKFLDENELAKSLKVLEKDLAAEEEPAKPKKALAALELTAASQVWFDSTEPAKPRTLEAVELYPAVKKLLTESGLSKTLKAFDKETASEEEPTPKALKKAKALADLELVAAAQLWRDAQAGNGAEEEAPKKQKKRKAAEEAAEAEEPAEEEQPKKKKKKAVEAEKEEEAEAEEAEVPKKEKKEKKEKAEKVKGVPFQRIDHDKWVGTIKDARLKDNTHEAKVKFGGSVGDSWADKASEDMLKVKGKGFRKEMAKKKRASWRGGGEIDQGVNSIKFSDSESE